ncbi:MAG: LPS export ABC transporter periplasmic protein LptC [Bacteroidota bacterium]
MSFLKKLIIIKVIIAISMAIITFGCKNDIAKVNSLTAVDKKPDEQAKNVSVIYSDSGKVLFVLTSDLMNKFINNDPYIEFPKGIKLASFDENGVQKTTLTANYAISYDARKSMEARSKVVIKNHQNDEIIETEHIVWDQLKNTIYSDVFVKRTNPTGVMYGDGFDADETFSKYTIRNPRATFYFEERKDDREE